jgi:hypothetical protein
LSQVRCANSGTTSLLRWPFVLVCAHRSPSSVDRVGLGLASAPHAASRKDMERGEAMHPANADPDVETPPASPACCRLLHELDMPRATVVETWRSPIHLRCAQLLCLEQHFVVVFIPSWNASRRAPRMTAPCSCHRTLPTATSSWPSPRESSRSTSCQSWVSPCP